MAEVDEILVYYNGQQTSEPVLMGVLGVTRVRGKELFSFEYDDAWLKDSRFRSFDPDLQLFKGRQYVPQDKSNFGIFTDSTPDRWGRLLLDRREIMRSRIEERKPRPLRETDYLLGVFDESRMGALRFKLVKDGVFLDNDVSLSSPPWTSLRDLEYASLQFEIDEELKDSKWLKMLIQPGSSLGGARPKANVLDKSNHLWIAKFPSRNDRKDVGAWEAVCTQLAKDCKIQVSDFMLEKFNTNYHTFLSKRFDRTISSGRIQFTSAMTLLGYSDGADSQNGVSYLELAEWIMRNCCDVQGNLLELYRRIAFNVAVSNCDDHLRNHGFLYTGDGWTLSPAYDLTPDEYGTDLKLCINETESALSNQTVIGIAPYFGIPDNVAKSIISEISDQVSKWRSVASQFGISRSEIEMMASAFEVKE